MAYMSQEKKAEIAKNLKNVMPAGWKYSLSVRHHSTLVLTVSQAPINVIAEYDALAKRNNREVFDENKTSMTIQGYWLDDHFEGERRDQIKAIFAVMNDGNHDRSDIQTDYFDVGWYSEICFGRWNKPFLVAA